MLKTNPMKFFFSILYLASYFPPPIALRSVD